MLWCLSIHWGYGHGAKKRFIWPGTVNVGPSGRPFSNRAASHGFRARNIYLTNIQPNLPGSFVSIGLTTMRGIRPAYRCNRVSSPLTKAEAGRSLLTFNGRERLSGTFALAFFVLPIEVRL
jgi:hypothetical protein